MDVNLSETWIVVDINGSNYCVNSEYVKGISELSASVFKSPAKSSRFVRGHYLIYGTVLPVIDVRRVLGYSSIEDKKIKFSDAVHKVIYEHETWIDELEWAVYTKDEFSKSREYSDSGVLKFVRDLDVSSDKIEILTKKIEVAIEIIYGLTNDILKSKNSLYDCQDKLEEIKRQSNKYVIKSLDSIIEIHNEMYSETCLVIRCKGISFGIAVDSIEMISDKSKSLNKHIWDRISAGTIQIKSKEYNVLNLTKLLNIIKSEERVL